MNLSFQLSLEHRTRDEYYTPFTIKRWWRFDRSGDFKCRLCVFICMRALASVQKHAQWTEKWSFLSLVKLPLYCIVTTEVTFILRTHWFTEFDWREVTDLLLILAFTFILTGLYGESQWIWGTRYRNHATMFFSLLRLISTSRCHDMAKTIFEEKRQWKPRL